MEGKDQRIIEYKEKIRTLEEEIKTYNQAVKEREKQIVQGYEKMDQMLKEVEDQRDSLKQAHEDLRKAHEFVGRISDTMDDVLVVLGVHGKIQRINNKLVKLVGKREKEILGQFPDFLFGKEDLNLLRESHAPEKKEGEDSVVYSIFTSKRTFECKAHLVCKGGKETIHLFRSSLLISPKGQIEGAVIIGTDIAELISTQENLSKALEEVTALKNALWGEMQLAKRIQAFLLPKKPAMKGYEIAAYLEPTDDVGGDYYDVINVEGLDWIIIGDVSGHGVPAGLIMMMVQSSIHTTLIHQPNISPSRLLGVVNQTITSNIRKLEEQKYMTIAVLALQEDGKFYFSGLHLQILVYRALTHRVESIDTRGMWIGIEKDISSMLRDDSLQVSVGDVLLLYTDGITEAVDPGGNMFTSQKLMDVLEQLGSKSPQEIKEKILQDLEGYKKDDDVTVLVIKRLE